LRGVLAAYGEGLVSEGHAVMTEELPGAGHHFLGRNPFSGRKGAVVETPISLEAANV
jgi:hypothetical protein